MKERFSVDERNERRRIQIFHKLRRSVREPIEVAACGEGSQLLKEEKNQKIQEHIQKKEKEFLTLDLTTSHQGAYKWLKEPENQIYLPFLWDRVSDDTTKKKNLQNAVVSLIRRGKLNRNALFGADLSSPPSGEKINLDGTYLEGADLRNANFSFVSLKGVDFRKMGTETDAEGANFSGASIGIDQLLEAWSLYKIQLPTIPKKTNKEDYKFSINKGELLFHIEGFDKPLELTLKIMQKVGIEESLFQVLSNAVKLNPEKPTDRMTGGEWEKICNGLSKLYDSKVKELEDKVRGDYLANFCKHSLGGVIQAGEKQTSEEIRGITQASKEINWKLDLIRFSGFSPLEWGTKPDQFEEKLQFLENNKDQILPYMLNRLSTLESDYERDRTGDKEHGFFRKHFTKRDERKDQIDILNSAATQVPIWQRGMEGVTPERITQVSLGHIINGLSKVKTQIEAEDNWMPSELLRKVNGILTDCFDKEKLAAVAGINKPEDRGHLKV